MKQLNILFFTFFLLSSGFIFSQSYTISGYIDDSESDEKLISANIFELRSASGTVTNTYGFYSLTLPKDSVELNISYIGYQRQTIKFYLNKDTVLNFQLSSSVNLTVVEVKADKYERIENETQMSQIDVPIEQIRKIPALFGEVDVLKTLQLLPGVQSGGEGQTGLYVRGGSPDQNLILLDGVPVYNVSHLLGIFSVFNADAIKNVTLTKGGFPARYGGRLSSILEINMKEGNMQEFHGEGSIGLISSKLTLEGPINKGKTSFLISGRRTYADLIAKPLAKSAASQDGVDFNLALYFYDLNAKIQHKFNEKHRLFLSAYSGADVFKNKFSDDDDVFEGGIDWGNVISALRWNYQINNKLFANTTLTFSDYDIDIKASQEFTDQNETEKYSAQYFSGIRDWAAKIDLDYIPTPKHYVRFGASATHHTYEPGALVLKVIEDSETPIDTTIGSQNATSAEFGLYIEDDMAIGPLKLNVGLHYSGFLVEKKYYQSLQPRLGIRYLLNNDIALKASFSTTRQYINLLTSESLSLPTDLWVPSTKRIKPQQSWQAAIGAAKTFFDEFEFSIEGYYKKMDNVLSFKQGASFLLGIENNWQDKVTQGEGESYGLEFFLQKKKGKTTGWIGYTLAWNNRTFDEINGGRSFPFRYDRRHDVSVVVSHEFTKRISASAAWVFGTGNAVTLPISRYANDIRAYNGGQENIVYEYRDIETLGDKNAFRMSNYHRLDLSVEFKKQMKKHERAWVISVYNAYWHRNPYFVLSDTDPIYDPVTGQRTGEKRIFKEVNILPIIPSFAYKFKF